MKIDKLSSARLIVVFSSLFIMGSIILQALSAHLPDHFFQDIHHRQFLLLSGNALLWYPLGILALTFGSFTPLCPPEHQTKFLLAAWGMVFGLLLFSGSLLLLSFNLISPTFFTPSGAIVILLSWIIPAFVCISAIVRKKCLD